jgi:hypothetical protein
MAAPLDVHNWAEAEWPGLVVSGRSQQASAVLSVAGPQRG